MIADALSVLDTRFLGNSLSAYLITIGVFLVVFLGLHLLLLLLRSRLNVFVHKTKNQMDDALIHILRKIHPIEYACIALYIALQMLTLSPLLNKIISIGFITLLVYMAVGAGSILLTSFLQGLSASDDSGTNAPVLMNLSVIGKALLWIFGIFLVLSNAGVDITSLIAGLGIGGIAVALALQNVLGDLFSSFAIYFDKPFLVGDFIIVGDKMGVVQKIGIKTTRVQALQGEEIVFANKDLTAAEIQNFKKMRERRVLFSVGVAFETPPHILQEIPALLRGIVEDQELVRFDRAHFARIDSSAFTFEIVYYVLSDNYNTFMDIQQKINFGILQAFLARGITIAYPTQTLYIQQAAVPAAVATPR